MDGVADHVGRAFLAFRASGHGFNIAVENWLVEGNMVDRYTKAILTVIAVALVWLALKDTIAPIAWGRDVVQVEVVGGRLDYETDMSAGPTLKICTNC
jgi:hypothetical protein